MDRHGRQRIAQLYDNPLQRGYVRGKLAGDPVYAATAALVTGTAMPLLDIGCGIGLLGLYLHARDHARPYLGLDHDARKIAAGQRAAQRAGLGASISLRHADVAELPPMHGHVALLDVLHYLPAERQPVLLREAARHLAPDGCLIIRNVLREPTWRFHATRVEEFFLRVSGWIPGGAQHYPSAGEVRAPLEDAELEVRIEPLRGHTPFNSYLILAQPHR
ncbi:class I SAM-dependent methyltransferase [Rhodanobacter denitrificans]|uniref:class I SAM-dependent methyltransferase n=1 Tax=Rhodanobacter denitrificans TaxID=666685 RepID=UPI001F33C9B7|nr:class I SAM-dependent methyltransferase [Rhodanobacter denitrificans]UJJ59005.1 class I SAM-dependent methyltransferase [Rhodanobacter denitrificans]